MLPFWRGNYPFYSVLGAGQAESGITIHHIDLGMDTGKLIHIEKCAVSAWDTYESLADKGAGRSTDRAPFNTSRPIVFEFLLGTVLSMRSISATQHSSVIGCDTADGWVEGCENRAVPMVLRRLLAEDSAFIEGYAQDEAKAGSTGKGAAFQEEWHRVDASLPLAEALTQVRAAHAH